MKKCFLTLLITGAAFYLQFLPMLASGATFTWVGSVSDDWFDPGNWNPAGVPSTSDTVNITNGSIDLTTSVIINGQFNWSGGYVYGNPLIIDTNGNLNISGSDYVELDTVLTNRGTVTWTGSTIGVANSAVYQIDGLIQNSAGGFWNIQCDQFIFGVFADTNAFFQNAGTITKSATTGLSTYFQLPLYNTGKVTTQSGTIEFDSGGTLDGIFNAVSGTTNNFAGGDFDFTAMPALNGAGTFELTGGNLALLNGFVPNLQLVSGSVSLSTNFQGGSITNLTLTNIVLNGNYTVTGTFNCDAGVTGNLTVASGAFINWSGGGISGDLLVEGGGILNWAGGFATGPLTIASNGMLNLNGDNIIYIENTLTNAGTVTWSGGDLEIENSTNFGYSGQIQNLVSGVWKINCDRTIYASFDPAIFYNAGTVEKSLTSGATGISTEFNNSGIVTVQSGTLYFEGGGILEGAFNAASGTSNDFSGGDFSYSAVPVLNGPGEFALTGGNLMLTGNAIPNLQLLSGSVSLPTNFQGGAITNLTLTNVALNGDYTVTGIFNCGGGIIGNLTATDGAVLNWSGGDISGNLLIAGGATLNWSGGISFGPITIAKNGLLNLNVNGGTVLLNALTNAGTVNWNGGAINVENLSFDNLNGQIQNLASGTWNIECDQTIFNAYGGTNGVFYNEGVIQKSVANGTSIIELPFENTGTVTLLSGTVEFNSGGTLAGSMNAAAGTAIDFTGGAFTLMNSSVLTGPNSAQIQFFGGSILFSEPIINLNLSGATLLGTNTVTGAMFWTGGTAVGPLTIATNGTLNFSGNNTIYIQNPLTNEGTVNWTGGNLELQNESSFGYSGQIQNLAGAIWNIGSDQGIYNYYDNTNAVFYNVGIVQQTASNNTASISVAFENAGTLSVPNGQINLDGGFASLAGTLSFGIGGLNNFGQVIISGNAVLNGTLDAVLLGGYSPAINNSFPVVTFGSHNGTFTAANLPAGLSWRTNYSQANFSLVVADINKLAIITEPTGTNAGAILSPVTVQVEDALTGNQVAANGVPVTLALGSGSGILRGTLTKNTDATGKASFNDLSVTLDGQKTLQASAPEITPITGTPFTITTGIPAQLALITPFGTVQQNGVTFSPAAVVQVEDQFGNAVSNSTISIAAMFTSNGHGSLLGATAVHANGTNGTSTFNNLNFNLATNTVAESVVIYFESPGLASVTNSTVNVGFVFEPFALTNGNTVVWIDPTTQDGVFSWTVDGIEQVNQKWFWLGAGSSLASFDHFGPPLGLISLSASNAAISYFPQGLNVTVGFTLTGGAAGSGTSSLAQNLSIQNTNNSQVPLHIFAYSDFDLAGAPEGDAVSFPNANQVLQQGKKTVMTETIQGPAPNEWESSWYDLILIKLTDGSPCVLSDALIPQAPGDQTFAFEWDTNLAAGQTMTINLIDCLQPSVVLLSIAASGTNVVISWPTKAASSYQLFATTALGASENWSVVTNSMMTVDSQYQVTLPAASNARFFRLQP